jgi:tetrapyrrole methylase family protein/MazG family protein
MWRMKFQEKGSYGIDDLLTIMTLLRSPDGCPWDREQTHASIRKNFLEECYEAVEAIDTGDTALLREELGDVLLQVVFHAEMERERGSFDFGDVCDGICKKLILRHPHIFGDVTVRDSREVLENWDAIKKQEKQQNTHTDSLLSVPRILPALMRSEKVQGRAAKAGFCYPDISGAMEDLRSEVDELDQAIKKGATANIREELGDVLFSAANVARFAGADSEQCLTESCDKFISRFSKVEAMAKERKIDLIEADKPQLETLWQEAKTQNE